MSDESSVEVETSGANGPGGMILSSDVLRASGALLAAQTALAGVIEAHAVGPSGHDATTLDLLVRLDQATDNRLRAVELSRQLFMSPSHISRRVDRAEGLGLVRRESDPDDRRASQIVLTEDGRAALRVFGPRLEAVIRRVVDSSLSDDEIDSLVALLSRLELAARTVAADGA